MGKEMMSKDEMVRLALESLGDASVENLAAFVEQKFGVKINPRYIPIFKASLRGKEHFERLNEAEPQGKPPSTS